ncbi:MAG: class B sortase [Oscillospiraceae bacterium]|nr:class B sortase [Oscillospiraceae bacterium]
MKRKITVIQALLVLIFILCAGYAGKYFYDANKAQSEYDTLRQTVENSAPADASDGYIEKRADNGMLEKYYLLYTQNSDMVGWLNIPDTAIDYPVVQYTDNDFYLHRNFEKKNSYSGIPFLDYECAADSTNKIIYAHNMKNGSMFAALNEYADKEFYNSHKRINFDTLYDEGEYEVISVFSVKVGVKDEFKYYEYTDLSDEERFCEYTDKLKSLSLYDTDADAQWGDSLITLSTCAYHTSDERFVVAAKKIK